MRTHRTTACMPAAHSSRQECIIFLSVPEFFKTNCLIYPILPEFYQNSFCRTLKKESNSINLDFYKCLNFLLSMSCSIHFLKNPIPQILQSKPIPPTKHCLVCRRKRRSGAQVRYTPLCGVSLQPNGLHCQEGEPQPAPSQQRCKCYDFLYFLL